MGLVRSGSCEDIRGSFVRKGIHKVIHAPDIESAIMVITETDPKASSFGVRGVTSKARQFKKYDFVFSVGCFDLFHKGHVKLLRNMKKLGKKIVVGVHDSDSITKLKNRVPIDSTEKRVANVQNFADYVYVISGTDPTPFIKQSYDIVIDNARSISKKQHKGRFSSVYVRGDDMCNFPGRELVLRTLDTILFLPYTKGVSSTMLREQLLKGKSIHSPC
eukprot:Nk52_evm40s1992 gene=Nk52_evmTU40s1992